MNVMTAHAQVLVSSTSRSKHEMKGRLRSRNSAPRRRESLGPLRDPAFWAWLIVVMLALIPAAEALHVMLV